MKGYELTFMAPRSRRWRGESVLDAVVRLAKAQGVTRHTRRIDTESVGAGGARIRRISSSWPMSPRRSASSWPMARAMR